MQKALDLLDRSLADLREERDKIDATIRECEEAREELLAEPADDAGDEADDSPERNGTHPAPARVAATPPPPVKRPGDGPPPCLAGMRTDGRETAKRLAAALDAGPLKLATIMERLGMSDQGARKLLGKVGADLPAAERLVARDLDGRFNLTDLGRKWLLG